MFTTKEGLEVASDINKPKHVSHDLVLKNSNQVVFLHVSPTAPTKTLKIRIEESDLMAFINTRVKINDGTDGFGQFWLIAKKSKLAAGDNGVTYAFTVMSVYHEIQDGSRKHDNVLYAREDGVLFLVIIAIQH